MTVPRLLDVNVVIALIDPLHVHHERAHQWFETESSRTWHTCPLVQNGVIRVVSHPKYPNSQPSPAVARSLLSLLSLDTHVFLGDSVSLLDGTVDIGRVVSGAQVTDTYLLHLARSAGARLATFDRRIVVAAVPGGAECVEWIP